MTKDVQGDTVLRRFSLAFFGSLAFAVTFSFANSIIYLMIDALPDTEYGLAYLYGTLVVLACAIIILFFTWLCCFYTISED